MFAIFVILDGQTIVFFLIKSSKLLSQLSPQEKCEKEKKGAYRIVLFVRTGILCHLGFLMLCRLYIFLHGDKPINRSKENILFIGVI